MSIDITGTWKLLAWRRLEEGKDIAYPLGEDATGVLIYAPNGFMAVQMVAADRPNIESTDALGGDVDERATAYSTCLAYYGSYEIQGDSVVHRLEGSLYPNWSGTLQSRPFTYDGDVLVLRTPPSTGPDGTVVNEISWERETSNQN
jgi:hypothetical protein